MFFLCIIFIIIACILPFLGISKMMKGTIKEFLPFSIGSFTALLVALLLNLNEINNRVLNQDWSGLSDTMNFNLKFAIFAAILIVLINLFSLILNMMNKKK
jgi:hypothetical protein